MSKIESQSKETLAPLISGSGFKLPKESLCSVTVAAALIAIMHGFTGVKEWRIIKYSHRNYIMRNKRLPGGWFVAIGLADDDAPLRARSKFYKTNEVGLFSVSTFFIGKAIPQVIVFDHFCYPVTFPKGSFVQIWPLVDVDPGWYEKITLVAQ